MYSNGSLANKMLPQPMVLVDCHNDIGLQLVQHRPMLVLLSVNLLAVAVSFKYWLAQMADDLESVILMRFAPCCLGLAAGAKG